MEEKRGISSGVSSEPASISGLSGEKRNGDVSEEKDELGCKRAKVRDLDSDAKSSNQNIGVAQQPKLSSEHMSEVLVTPDAEGLGRLVREKEVLAKDRKRSTVLRTSTCLPRASSVSKDVDRLLANTGKQALPENRIVKDDRNCETRGVHVDAISKNSILSKPKEIPESVVSPRDPSVSNPISEKAGPFQMCSAVGSLEKSDSMRRWMEMKRNGFLSGPLGGVSAPSSAVSTTPVELPAQKQQKNKRRGDSFKKRNEVPRKEQQLVDRFSNVTAPSGLLTELNPGIIHHVRSKKQVFSIIQALIRNATGDATVGERNADLNVRVREDRALAVKLPFTGVSNHANSFTNPEQATSLAVEEV